MTRRIRGPVHIQSDPTDKPQTVQAGTLLGRDRNSTPGAQNYQPLYVIAQDGAKPTRQKKWTVLLYMVADDYTLEGLIYQNVKNAEQAGGSDDNMNVVVLLDGKNMIVQAKLDRDGKPVAVPTTQGGTWQFQSGRARDTSTCEEDDEGEEEGVCYITMLNQPGENPFLGEKNMGDPATLKALSTGPR